MTVTRTPPLYLVIDQGGHASRALIFNQDRQVISEKSVDIETIRYNTDRVEHDPEALINSIVRAVEGAVSALGDRVREIDSIGIATQRSSIVCWDKNTGAALSPVISWQDRRTSDRIEKFLDHTDEVHALTGLVLSPHYGATKLRWCLDHLADVQQARKENRLACGPVSSFILFRLLDERPFVVDPANASRTLLWDYTTRMWAPGLLELFGVPEKLLPRCVPNRYDYGHMEIASRSIPVRVVTGDQSAALFAFGTPRSDTTYINVGTGAFLQRMIGSKPLAAPRLLSSVVWQSDNDISYVLEGTVNGAGSALHQVSNELGLSGKDVHVELDQGLTAVENPPLFLNGVSGLGSPFWIADFPSRFVGEGNKTEKLVAVLESIVFLIRVNLDEMATYLDAPRRIVITGGLAALVGLCQRLADLSGLSVERPEVQEATARGLAYLLTNSSSVSQIENVNCVVFKPVSNFALETLYKRWLEEMKNCGAAHL